MELVFSDGSQFELSYELLRVYSPSAEVRGHGPGQEVLQVGKRDVDIVTLEPVGNYAVQPTFSDGHSTGIYSWDYLFWLGTNRDSCGGNTSSASRRPGQAASRAPRLSSSGRNQNSGAAPRLSPSMWPTPLPAATSPFEVVLINPYELGRQPFGLAEPAALLKRAGFAVACLDLSLQKLDPDILRNARLVALLCGHAYRHPHRGARPCPTSDGSPRRRTSASTGSTRP